MEQVYNLAPPTSCPLCGRSEAWSVWTGDSGELMGTCHRATCSYDTRRLGGSAPVRKEKKEPRYFTRPTQEPTADHQLMFHKLYGLPRDTVLRYSPTDDRFLLHVDGPDSRRGYIARSMSGAEPKTLTYNERPDEPFIHWTAWFGARRKAVVVVEDWFSAEKVSLVAGAGAVSLNGSTLSEAMVQEIAKPGLPVFLALDLDAYPKAVEYAARYRMRFKDLKLWRLRVDLKYESIENIESALNGSTCNFGDFAGAANV